MEFKKRPITCPGTQPGGGAQLCSWKISLQRLYFQNPSINLPNPRPPAPTPTPLGPSEVLPFPISQVVKASESCSKVHLKVSSISAVPKEIVPVPC